MKNSAFAFLLLFENVNVQVVVLGQVQKLDPVVGVFALQVEIVPVPDTILQDRLREWTDKLQDTADALADRFCLDDVIDKGFNLLANIAGHFTGMDRLGSRPPPASVVVAPDINDFLYGIGSGEQSFGADFLVIPNAFEIAGC